MDKLQKEVNMKNSHKYKMVTAFLAKGLLVLVLALLPGLVIMLKIDPYNFLGLQKGHIYVPVERYQIPGLALHENYDTCILGSSMIENFSEKRVDEKLGVHSIRLPINASYVIEQRMALDLAMQNHQIKTVIWGIDYRSVDIKNGDLYSKNVVFPEFMYDNQPLNDWKYLVNHYNFFLGLKQLYMRKTGINPYDYFETDRETLNSWSWKRFGRDLILTDYKALYEGSKPLSDKINNLDAKYAFETIDKTVIDAAAKYKDTRFVFLLPPKPVLWFKLLDEKGVLEKKLSVQQYFVDQASKYPNCEVYNFQNVWDITENLDLYLDITHYSQVGNNYMTDSIAEKRHLTTPESFKSEAAELLARVRSEATAKVAESALK